MLDSFRAAVTAARRHGDLYFAALLSEQRILEALGSASSLWQGWVYTPAVTVWVFLSQCLSADHSCRDAVARLAAWRVTKGLAPCSAETGGYCIARSHLPEEACRQLMRRTGQELEDEAPAAWLWHGRRVRVVDGSTVCWRTCGLRRQSKPLRQSAQSAFPELFKRGRESFSTTMTPVPF